MNTEMDAKLDVLLKQMEADRPALQELAEVLPILIAGLVQVKARLDTHDEIMRLCIVEDQPA